MKNASASFAAISPRRMASTLSTALDAVAVEHRNDGADLAEQIGRHHEVGAARRQDRGDADAALAGKLRDRRERRQPDAAAEHHDVLPCGIEMKADPERADHVEPVARLERRQPAGAAADAFVEKLDAAVARGRCDRRFAAGAATVRPASGDGHNRLKNCPGCAASALADAATTRCLYSSLTQRWEITGHSDSSAGISGLGRLWLAHADKKRRRGKGFTHLGPRAS